MFVAKAQKLILSEVKPLKSEMIKFNQALGRALAEDIYSPEDIPGFDNSAMDGYAVRAVDLKGATSVSAKLFKVIDEIKAGVVPRKILKKGQAIRIMTGAMMPKGADSVVMVEFTQKLGRKVKIFKDVTLGENVRRKGEDVKKGERVILKGTRLNSGHIGLLASIGRLKIKVTRIPRVAILVTGDEVVDVGKRLAPGKIRSSNTYTLISQVESCGAIPRNFGIAKDNPVELERKIRECLSCDMIITSGGVSVGDYDLVKDILRKVGTKIKLWKVAMRPGKPLAFGVAKNVPVFGLPGNPVSSMVTFEVYVRPAILKMLGIKDNDAQEVEAVLEENISKRKGLRYFIRAKTRWENGAYRTKSTGPQGSGILKSMALANSLIILPEEIDSAPKNSKVKVKLLN